MLLELVECSDNAGVIVNPKGEMKGMVKHMKSFLLILFTYMIVFMEPFEIKKEIKILLGLVWPCFLEVFGVW